MGLITKEQQAQFDAQGFLLISGLMTPEISAQAEAAMWRILGIDPEDTTTWLDARSTPVTSEPEILATFTPAVCAAATELSEETTPLTSPSRTLAINVFPQKGPWTHHGPHIDHAIKADGFRTFPRPMRIATLTYMNDVPVHGANTVVWPGSHKTILALAESDPQQYETMWALNQALPTLELSEALEIPGKRGDVLFYHYLCAHSGSRNTSSVPRFALAHKW